MGIVSGYILILLARKYNNNNFWPLSSSKFYSENYIFNNMSAMMHSPPIMPKLEVGITGWFESGLG